MLEIYFDRYNDLVVKRKKIKHKYSPDNLIPGTYEYEDWYGDESNHSTIKK